MKAVRRRDDVTGVGLLAGVRRPRSLSPTARLPRSTAHVTLNEWGGAGWALTLPTTARSAPTAQAKVTGSERSANGIFWWPPTAVPTSAGRDLAARARWRRVAQGRGPGRYCSRAPCGAGARWITGGRPSTRAGRSPSVFLRPLRLPPGRDGPAPQQRDAGDQGDALRQGRSRSISRRSAQRRAWNYTLEGAVPDSRASDREPRRVPRGPRALVHRPPPRAVLAEVKNGLVDRGVAVTCSARPARREVTLL